MANQLEQNNKPQFLSCEAVITWQLDPGQMLTEQALRVTEGVVGMLRETWGRLWTPLLYQLSQRTENCPGDRKR